MEDKKGNILSPNQEFHSSDVIYQPGYQVINLNEVETMLSSVLIWHILLLNIVELKNKFVYYLFGKVLVKILLENS